MVSLRIHESYLFSLFARYFLLYNVEELIVTLKNKNGTVYRLKSPNPIMKEQKTWEEFRVHNMHWGSEIQPDTSELQAIKTDFQVKNSFIDDLDQAATEESNTKVVETPVIFAESKTESKINVVEKKIVEIPGSEKLDRSIPRVFIYCLPAFLEEKIDEIYGEKTQTLKYNNPFSFEGVVLDESDLTFKFWTQSDSLTNQILQGSIVYPRDRRKRWWRVQNVFEKTGGWVITAHPSDYHPHFDF